MYQEYYGTGEGEEYEEENYKKYGKYIPQVVSFEKLKKIKLVPETLKKEIIRDYLYIIGKSKKKYTLKILQEESKKRVQNRKYLRKEQNSEKGYIVEETLEKNNEKNPKKEKRDRKDKKDKKYKKYNRKLNNKINGKNNKNASNKSNILGLETNRGNNKKIIEREITQEEKERLKRNNKIKKMNITKK